MATQQRPHAGQQRQGGYQQRDDGRIRIDINSYQPQIQNWITNQIDENTIVFADGFGRQIADGGLTTSQIRIVFGEMRRIQMNGYKNQKTDFLLLKAKLAYAVKRHNKPGLTDFFKLFEKAYDAVNKNNDDIGEKNFKNMMDLTEAILAYHKYHGGKE